MARMTISGGDEIELMLAKLGASSFETGKRAVREAADIVANKVRSNLDKLPEDTFRKLAEGEQFSGVPKSKKKDLLDGLGITPVGVSDEGTINIKVGFQGNGAYPTRKYPKGLPNQLLARVVESGSSVRKKTPFIRPAVNQTEQQAINKMQEVINREIEKS